MKRVSISKRRRFEILKRDGFACLYCGRKSPDVELHVDHVIPVAVGGTSNDDNLAAACSDCNGGKGAVPLGESPDPSLTARREELAAVLREAEDSDIDLISECWRHMFGSEPGYRETLRVFLKRIDIDGIERAMEIAHAKESSIAGAWSSSQRFRYFAGVCWRKARELGVA